MIWKDGHTLLVVKKYAYYMQNNQIYINLYIYITVITDVWKGAQQNVKLLPLVMKFQAIFIFTFFTFFKLNFLPLAYTIFRKPMKIIFLIDIYLSQIDNLNPIKL